MNRLSPMTRTQRPPAEFHVIHVLNTYIQCSTWNYSCYEKEKTLGTLTQYRKQIREAKQTGNISEEQKYILKATHFFNFTDCRKIEKNVNLQS